MAYVNGNLALQPKRKPDQKQKNFRETRKVVVKRKSIPVQEKLLYMFTILVCVIVAGVIIMRYAQIYQMDLEIKNLTKQQAQMETDMVELKKQVALNSSPEKIKEKAAQMGFAAPDDEPIKVNTAAKEPIAMKKE
ncbi:FtsL-like putative cell division protein [Paenibacillus solisilvae]|uniref:FtsL-like putative cell division protein n=1 Tax=Paenibacillus solisilvae TaxID=2486751 RepID=A0ABW0W5J1_9BACL